MFEFLIGNFPLQFGLSVVICFAFHGLRLAVDPIAASLGQRLGARNQVEMNKFSSQLVNLVFHAVSGLYLADIIFRNEWLETPAAVWEHFARDEPNSWFVVFYCGEFGYHLQRLFGLFVKDRKKDFVEMALHHFVTAFLLGYSSYAGYLRMGMLVLMVHDISDSLGCLCKMLSACNQKTGLILSFFPMQGLWFYTRLYLLPFKIIPIASLCPAGSTSFGVAACVCALYILVGLNAYWYHLFMKMLYNVIVTKGKVAADIQEDSHSTAAGETVCPQ